MLLFDAPMRSEQCERSLRIELEISNEYCVLLWQNHSQGRKKKSKHQANFIPLHKRGFRIPFSRTRRRYPGLKSRTIISVGNASCLRSPPCNIMRLKSATTLRDTGMRIERKTKLLSAAAYRRNRKHKHSGKQTECRRLRNSRNKTIDGKRDEFVKGNIVDIPVLFR